jgi:hypothetical protein
MMKPLSILAVAAALSACATASQSAPAAPGEKLEAVYSVSAEKTVLALRVSSNGCTKAEDFAVTVDKAAGESVVTVRRTRQDPCRAFAIGGTVVRFSYEAIGLSGEFRVANPLAPWNGPGE